MGVGWPNVGEGDFDFFGVHGQDEGLAVAADALDSGGAFEGFDVDGVAFGEVLGEGELALGQWCVGGEGGEGRVVGGIAVSDREKDHVIVDERVVVRVHVDERDRVAESLQSVREGRHGTVPRVHNRDRPVLRELDVPRGPLEGIDVCGEFLA